MTKMNKTATIAAIILLMLPLLCYGKDNKINLEISDSSYNELVKKFKAKMKAKPEPLFWKEDAELKAIYETADEAERKKLDDAYNKAVSEIARERYKEELETKYEKKFKKPAHQWKENLLIGSSNPLERAIELDIPYLTREEEINLKTEDEKIKLEYKKKFGVPITDFELSTARVDFVINTDESTYFRFSVARTTRGAIAKYRREGRVLGLELNTGEWLDFINTLYKCRINEWEKVYGSWVPFDTRRWMLYITTLDKDIITFAGYDNGCGGNNNPPANTSCSGRRGSCVTHYVRNFCDPPNWNEFEKIIDDMETKIRKKAGVK